MAVTVDKTQNTTQCEFYDGLCATFAHPHETEKVVSVVHHAETGKFTFFGGDAKRIDFVPKNTMTELGVYTLCLDAEASRISVRDTADNEMYIAMDGEYKADLVDSGDQQTDPTADARLFVVYRDGNGYELLSNAAIDAQNERGKTQILKPEPLSDSLESPFISHRFVMERFAQNAPRTEIKLPSILGDTLNAKMDAQHDSENQRSCHIYRHILETPVLSEQDMQTAQTDLAQFKDCLSENELAEMQQDGGSGGHCKPQKVPSKAELEELAEAQAPKDDTDSEPSTIHEEATGRVSDSDHTAQCLRLRRGADGQHLSLQRHHYQPWQQPGALQSDDPDAGARRGGAHQGLLQGRRHRAWNHDNSAD